MLTGGCFCGKVRYRADGEPVDRVVCYCTMCRRTTGAPLVAWFTVKRTAFAFTAGEPKNFRSSPSAVRGFCPDCGAQLTFQAQADQIDVTTASLDDPEAVPPIEAIWASSRVSWVDDLVHIPHFTRTRQD